MSHHESKFRKFFATVLQAQNLPVCRGFHSEHARAKIFASSPPEVLQNGGAKNKNRIF